MTVLDPPAWTPTVDQVALRIIARTLGTNGALQKTFNDSTQPTGTDVAGMIGLVVQLLGPRLGPVPDALTDSACSLAALKTAITVEQSYFMEQVSAGASPVRELMGEYMASLTAWDMAARGEQPNGVKIASLPVGTLYSLYGTYGYGQ